MRGLQFKYKCVFGLTKLDEADMNFQLPDFYKMLGNSRKDRFLELKG